MLAFLGMLGELARNPRGGVPPSVIPRLRDSFRRAYPREFLTQLFTNTLLANSRIGLLNNLIGRISVRWIAPEDGRLEPEFGSFAMQSRTSASPVNIEICAKYVFSTT